MRKLGWMGPAVAALTIACGAASESDPAPEATVFMATGDVAAKVDEFRNALGPSNGGTAGEQPTGRREINWDGAAANPFNDRNDFPADFFNTNVKSGAVFTTAGTGFRNDSTLFSAINPTYAAEFNFFSPTQIVATVRITVLDQMFLDSRRAPPSLLSSSGI